MKNKIISVVISLAVLISAVLCGCKDSGNETGSDASSGTFASSVSETASNSQEHSESGEAQSDTSKSTDSAAESGTSASSETSVSENTGSDILDTDEPAVYLKASQSGKNITVTGYVKNNPGIAGMSIRVDYDTSMVTPKKIEGKLMSVTSNLQQDGIDPDGFVTVVYVSSDGMTSNGELFVITFEKEKTGLATFKLMAGENSFVSPEAKYIKVTAVGNGITII